MNKEKTTPEMNSRLTKGEAIVAIGWLPMHMVVIPLALGFIMAWKGMSDVDMNLWLYTIGACVMLIFELGFFRRDFDPLVDRLPQILGSIILYYFAMSAGEIAVSLLLSLITPEGNPNNEAVTVMAADAKAKTTVMAVFLAPFVEEMIFRAGIFGTIRRKSRVWAYVVSIACFSLYHVASYITYDIRYLLYALQYLPSSYALCRLYERNDTIWAPIFLHMLTNYIALSI